MADIKFVSHADEVLRKSEQVFHEAMELVAQQGESNAIAEVTKLVYDTPESPNYVRTGALRNSIAHAYVREEKAAYIGTNLEYAPYVEYGTRNMHERPFLRNAAQNYSDEYKELLEDAIKKLS